MYIIDLIKRHLEPLIDRLWGSIIFWRSLSIILLLGITISFKYRDRIKALLFKSKIIDHDIKIFTLSNQLMNEASLFDLLNQLGDGHNYYKNSISCIGDFIHFFSEESNQYISKELRNTSKDLLSFLGSLLDFVYLNFWTFPENQLERFCLKPELNADRGGVDQPDDGRYYSWYVKELNHHLDNTETCYKKYRSLVKRILYL